MFNIKNEATSTHVEVEELTKYIGQKVLIHGIIYKIREMSGFAFIILKKDHCSNVHTQKICQISNLVI